MSYKTKEQATEAAEKVRRMMRNPERWSVDVFPGDGTWCLGEEGPYHYWKWRIDSDYVCVWPFWRVGEYTCAVKLSKDEKFDAFPNLPQEPNVNPQAAADIRLNAAMKLAREKLEALEAAKAGME